MLVGFTVANAVLYLGPAGTVYSERRPVYREVAERLRADACATGAIAVRLGHGAESLLLLGSAAGVAVRCAVGSAALRLHPGESRQQPRRYPGRGDVVPAHWDWLMGDLDRHRATFIVDTAPANLYRWGGTRQRPSPSAALRRRPLRSRGDDPRGAHLSPARMRGGPRFPPRSGAPPGRPNPERGVYRTRDGGRTCQRALFQNENSGAIDLVLDPSNPDVIYASTLELHRYPQRRARRSPSRGRQIGARPLI